MAFFAKFSARFARFDACFAALQALELSLSSKDLRISRPSLQLPRSLSGLGRRRSTSSLIRGLHDSAALRHHRRPRMDSGASSFFQPAAAKVATVPPPLISWSAISGADDAGGGLAPLPAVFFSALAALESAALGSRMGSSVDAAARYAPWTLATTRASQPRVTASSRGRWPKGKGTPSSTRCCAARGCAWRSAPTSGSAKGHHQPWNLGPRSKTQWRGSQELPAPWPRMGCAASFGFALSAASARGKPWRASSGEMRL